MAKSHRSTTYRIGDLAQRSGLTPDALRYYERMGLLRPVHRTTGRFRVYSEQALDRLRFIKQAQAVGLSLREIQDLLTYEGGGTRRCRRVHDMLVAKLADLEARVRELQEFRDELEHLKAECERTLESVAATAECPVIETWGKAKS